MNQGVTSKTHKAYCLVAFSFSLGSGIAQSL